MARKFWFLALVTPDCRSSGGPPARVLVFALPIPEALLRDWQHLLATMPALTPIWVPSPTPYLATPNSPSRAQGWPLQGPRVTRPSRAQKQRGRKSLGMSSFSAASSRAKGGGAK